jgi:hypothetical protein
MAPAASALGVLVASRPPSLRMAVVISAAEIEHVE